MTDLHKFVNLRFDAIVSSLLVLAFLQQLLLLERKLLFPQV